MNKFNLPIVMKSPIILTIFFGLGLCMFIFFSILSWIDEHNIKLTGVFLLFDLLILFTFISSRSSIEVSEDSITLNSPPRGKYQIKWYEVETIETNGESFSFLGNDKRLVIILKMVSNKRKPEFYDFLNEIIKKYNIKVEPFSPLSLTQKDTKISNLYF